MTEYVLYNKELGLFFGGFDCKYTKYIQKAHLFYSYGYACSFLNHYPCFTGFRVYDVKAVSKEILCYA